MSVKSKLLLSTFLFSTVGLAFSADWPQFGLDPTHSSFNPDEQVLGPHNVGDLEVLWTNSVPCTINEGMAVVSGTLYYGHYCGEFRAVDADTGVRLWTQSLDGKHRGQAVVDGVAYVTSSGAAYAFDAGTGSRLWVWDPEPTLRGPVVANGVVYVKSDDDILHALDAGTGTELRTFSPAGFPAVTSSALYVGADALRAYSVESGALLWTGTVEGQVVGDKHGPVVADGIVYAHSDAGYMYAFDAGGCNQDLCPPIWTAQTKTQEGEARQPPAVGEGKVYLGAGNTFYAFPATGCGESECPPLWETVTNCEFFRALPSVANGVVYSSCGNSYLYAFDATTGDVLWQYFTAGSGYPMRSEPVIVDGRLYHDATFDFTLYAFHVPAPPLGASVTGINVKSVGCVNRTDPQWTITGVPGLTLRHMWTCEEIGVDAGAGDEIQMRARGTAVTQKFFGRADGLASGGEVLCSNLSAESYISAPLAPDGSWDCVEMGLPIAPGDDMKAVVSGAVQ